MYQVNTDATSHRIKKGQHKVNVRETTKMAPHIPPLQLINLSMALIRHISERTNYYTEIS